MIKYDKLIDYLLEEWGREITIRVIGEINHQVSRIQNHPEQFPVILKKKKISHCVLSPQTSIFFKSGKNKIEIISLFDNRQDPIKRKF